MLKRLLQYIEEGVGGHLGLEEGGTYWSFSVCQGFHFFCVIHLLNAAPNGVVKK